MAQSGYTPILIYASGTTGNAPVAANLTSSSSGAELALNYFDGKLFYKDASGNVQVLAVKMPSGILPTTAGGTGLSSWTAGDLPYYASGTALSKLGIGTNGYILTSNGTAPVWTAGSSISVNTATNLAGGAAGSVPYQSGAGATTFLSIGTANTVMTSSGTAPQWSSSLTLGGNLVVNGNTTLGDAAADTVTINGTITSNLIFTDNTYDIGASGATRPRNLYLAGLLTMGGALTVNGNTTLGDAAADTVTINGTITSNLIFTDNTYDIGASGATRPRNLYLAGTATLGSTASAARYIVNSASNAGTTDISLGSYSSGAWLNSPSGTTAYLATAGNGVLSWSTGLVDVPAGVLKVSGTGSRGVRLTGLGSGEVAIAGDGTTYAVGVAFYDTTSYLAVKAGIYAYGSGGAINYLSIGGNSYNTAGLYVTPGTAGSATVSVAASSQPFSSAARLHVKDTIALGTSLYTFGTIDQSGSAGGITITANAYPANTGLNSFVSIRGGTSGGGGPSDLAYFRSDGVTGLTNASPNTWSISPAIEGPYGSISLGSSLGNTLGGNVYYNGGYKYKLNSTATLYLQDSNGHHFYSTPTAGSAGGAITWATSLAMATSGNAASFGADATTAGYLAVYYGNSQRPIFLGNGNALFYGEAGGWQIGSFAKSSVGTTLAGFGFLGNNASLDFEFIGPDYTSTHARFTANGMGLGNTTPANSGTGITFPATQSSSSGANTLDDYERGNWTPSLASTGGATFTYGANTGGTYIKIGRWMYLMGVMNVATKSGGSSGDSLAIILPIAAGASDVSGSGVGYHISAATCNNLTVPSGYSGFPQGGVCTPNQATFYPFWTDGTNNRILQLGDIANGFQIQFSIAVFTNT